MNENFQKRVKSLIDQAVKLPSKLGVWSIKVYKITLSPLFALLGCQCRFYPTCSEYTAQAITKHGLFKGCILGAFRILRCNPLCKGGLDTVPDKFVWKNLFSKRR